MLDRREGKRERERHWNFPSSRKMSLARVLSKGDFQTTRRSLDGRGHATRRRDDDNYYYYYALQCINVSLSLPQLICWNVIVIKLWS